MYVNGSGAAVEPIGTSFRAVIEKVRPFMERTNWFPIVLFGMTASLVGAGLPAAAQRHSAATCGSFRGAEPRQNDQAEFRPGVIKAPDGKTIGFVDMKIHGLTKRLVEIITNAGGLTKEQRAAKIADRFRGVQRADVDWSRHLSVGRIHGNWVVRAPKAPGGFLITADPAFAKESGLSSQDLSGLLIRNIRRIVDPATVAVRDVTIDRVADSRDKRVSGDNFYNEDDKAKAESEYKDAIQYDPTYIVPYLRLAALYAAQNEPDKVREILSAARQQKLDAEQKQQIDKLLSGLHANP